MFRNELCARVSPMLLACFYCYFHLTLSLWLKLNVNVRVFKHHVEIIW